MTQQSPKPLSDLPDFSLDQHRHSHLRELCAWMTQRPLFQTTALHNENKEIQRPGAIEVHPYVLTGDSSIGVKMGSKSFSSRRDGTIVARRFIAGNERPRDPFSSPRGARRIHPSSAPRGRKTESLLMGHPAMNCRATVIEPLWGSQNRSAFLF